MNARLERGSVLAETALVVTLALLIVFNALQLGLLGFYQLRADATAYAAARVAAISGSTSGVATTVAGILPGPVATPSITIGTSTTSATVGSTAPGFMLLPGLPATIPVTGQAIEQNGTQSTNFTYNFSVPQTSTAIANYYPQGTKNDTSASDAQSYNVYLAQALDAQKGYWWNNGGIFWEWIQHASCLADIQFPANYASTQQISSSYGHSGTTYSASPLSQWTTFTSSNNRGEYTLAQIDAAGGSNQSGWNWRGYGYESWESQC